MTFTEIYRSEATNPNTGEIVQAIRVRTDNQRTFKVLNSLEELKAFGTPQEVLKALTVREGEYGEYVQLPKHKKLEDLSW